MRTSARRWWRWRDPDPKATALAVGRGGKAVAELKAQLATLGRLDSANKGEQYDQDVARAVSRIQAETGLIIDGVAGRQMRMVMSSWAGGPEVPRLTKAASAAAPKAVASTAVTTAQEPAAEPEAKSAAKPEAKAEPAMTPLPTPEQLNKAATPAAPVDGVVQVKTLPKPDAETPAAPAPAATPTAPETPKE